MKNEDYDAIVQEGLQHLNFAIDLYHDQMARGDDFLHEHPHPASSWTLPRMQALLADPRVLWVRNDQCAAGMRTVDDDGEEQPAQKCSGWATTIPEVAEALAKFQCPNRDPLRKGEHTHTHLLNGRASAAANHSCLQ